MACFFLYDLCFKNSFQKHNELSKTGIAFSGIWGQLWNLFLFLFTFLIVQNNMDHTSAHFLSILSVASERNPSLPTSPSYRPRVKFYIAPFCFTYIDSWQLLSSRGPLPRRLYAGLLSWTKPIDGAPCLSLLCLLVLLFIHHFLRGCDQISRSQLLAVASIL